jgi:fermentation-respiration switch protein FrsA (DUF1100 family)
MKKLFLFPVMALFFTFAVNLVYAQPAPQQNDSQPETIPQMVMKTNVSFISSGMRIAGILFKPGESGRLPAIVISHPAGGVKEQTVSLYAEKLAGMGFAALVFDAAYQGESEGEPRGLEDPFQRAEDIRSAVTYLVTRSDIDEKRIGALGICASGSYVPFAAQTDRRIKAAATISAIEMGGVAFMDPGFRDAVLEQAGELRNAEARGEGVFMSNFAPSTRTEAEALPPRSFAAESYEYYRTPRGAHPRSTQWGIMRMDVAAQFDAFRHNDWISPRPLLMIAGTDADSRSISEDAIALAAEPKELYLVNGASHIDLYDKDQYVSEVVTKLADFFGKNL